MTNNTTPPPGEEERWLHGATEDSGHRGKGPRNYQRSDKRIFEDVCEALAQHDAIDASDIEVKVASGEVMLDGSVPSPRMKERVDELVAKIAGVKSVRDVLRARP